MAQQLSEVFRSQPYCQPSIRHGPGIGKQKQPAAANQTAGRFVRRRALNHYYCMTKQSGAGSRSSFPFVCVRMSTTEFPGARDEYASSRLPEQWCWHDTRQPILNRDIYFHAPHYRTRMAHSALRSDSRKVMRFYEHPDIPMLFGLSTDEGEVHNTAGAQAEAANNCSSR